MKHYGIFINGKWIKQDKGKIKKFTPLTNKLLTTYVESNNSHLKFTIESALCAQKKWYHFNREYRSKIIEEIAEVILKNKIKLANIERKETGKTSSQAIGEIEHCYDLWKYAASSLRTFNNELYDNLDNNYLAFTSYEPIGVVSLITPWNFPFIVLSERLPYILAAGCSVIIKPSEYASGTTLEFCNLIKNIKVPAGLINVLTGTGPKIGQSLVKNKKINMISFTGSTQTGKKIAKIASNNLTKLSLELGGKNPVVVFDSKNLKNTIKSILDGAFSNAGQACVAGNKILVNENIFDNFMQILIKECKKYKSNYFGPINNFSQLKKINNLVSEAKKNNIFPVYNGNISKKKSLFFEPIIYSNVPKKSSLYICELFAPILTVNSFKNNEEAEKLCNDTNYGLAAYIYTEDINTALHFSKKLKAGRIWLNSNLINFPQLSIGGYKESGIGRDSGTSGIKNYSETKSVILKNN